MRAQGSECAICAVSSWAGLINTSTVGVGGGAAYTISKHAVTLTMESLAHELRSSKDCKISTHVLCPAAVATKYMTTAASQAKAAGTYKSGASQVEAMMPTAMSAEGIASLLADGILRDKAFYIKGYDAAQPTELLHAMLEARCEDITNGRPPLSHLEREAGKPVRKKIGAAVKAGKERLKAEQSKL